MTFNNKETKLSFFFRQGSTEAIIDIIFKNPAVVKEDVSISTAAPPVVKLDNKKIAETFVESVKKGVVEEYNDVFDIDTNSVSFAGNYFLAGFQVLFTLNCLVSLVVTCLPGLPKVVGEIDLCQDKIKEGRNALYRQTSNHNIWSN